MRPVPSLPSVDLSPPSACGASSPTLLGRKEFSRSGNDHFDGVHQFADTGVLIPYHRCGDCGVVFTAALDTWSRKAFVLHIYNDDYLFSDPSFESERPSRNAVIVAGIWHYEQDSRSVIDYGGGTARARIRCVELRRLPQPRTTSRPPLRPGLQLRSDRARAASRSGRLDRGFRGLDGAIGGRAAGHRTGDRAGEHRTRVFFPAQRPHYRAYTAQSAATPGAARAGCGDHRQRSASGAADPLIRPRMRVIAFLQDIAPC